jgi:hypothetical protein
MSPFCPLKRKKKKKRPPKKEKKKYKNMGEKKSIFVLLT